MKRVFFHPMTKTNFQSEALIIIDMLNDFVIKGAPLEVPGAIGIVSNIAKRINMAQKSGISVIYACDRHKKNDSEFRVWPPHAVEETKGAEVVDGLKPKEGDLIIYKTTYSSFFGTDLERCLKKNKIKKLVLTGVCTEICVLYTAVDAYMRGYQIEAPEDCVAGLTKEDHRFALRQMKEVLKPRQV